MREAGVTTNFISPGLPRRAIGKTGADNVFYKEDVIDFNPHNDDPLVITVQYRNWDIKYILIDQDSSTDVLFWDTF